MRLFIRSFARNDAGITAMEYGMIAALVAVALLGIVKTLGDDLKQTFDQIQAGLADPNS